MDKSKIPFVRLFNTKKQIASSFEVSYSDGIYRLLYMDGTIKEFVLDTSNPKDTPIDKPCVPYHDLDRGVLSICICETKDEFVLREWTIIEEAV